MEEYFFLIILIINFNKKYKFIFFYFLTYIILHESKCSLKKQTIQNKSIISIL